MASGVSGKHFRCAERIAARCSLPCSLPRRRASGLPRQLCPRCGRAACRCGVGAHVGGGGRVGHDKLVQQRALLRADHLVVRDEVDPHLVGLRRVAHHGHPLKVVHRVHVCVELRQDARAEDAAVRARVPRFRPQMRDPYVGTYERYILTLEYK
eukprot:6210618-Pleurochrysis_carterae.AAC.6